MKSQILFFNLLLVPWQLAGLSARADEFATSPPGHVAAGPAIYLLDVFREDGRTFIHWKYNPAVSDWTSVEIADASGKVLAMVPRPDSRWNVTGSSSEETLAVTPVQADGTRGVTQSVRLDPPAPPVVKTGRIGIIKQAEKAIFVDEATGEVFHPQGFNYIPLDPIGKDHAIFQAQTSTAAADYDPFSAESVFRLLFAHHYNTVRIFLAGRREHTPGLAGEKGTAGLYTPYLDNFADFLARAARYGIHVIVNFCDVDIPHNAYFEHRVDGLMDGNPKLNGNPLILTSAGIGAQVEQAVSALEYLKRRNPELLKLVLGVEFNNEVSLRLAQWPFNQTGHVTLADGKDYDMSSQADRQRAAEEGWLHYYAVMNQAVKSVDPGLLTCEGEFTAAAVGRDYRKGTAFVPESGAAWDKADGYRCPPSLSLLARTSLDFIDVHVYSTKDPAHMDQEIDNSLQSLLYDDAVKAGLTAAKPLILGEFGSFSDKLDSTMEAGFMRIRRTREIVCGKYAFTGFLMWALETFQQTTIHQALEDNGAFVATFNTPPFWPEPGPVVEKPQPAEAVRPPIALQEVAPTGAEHGFLASPADRSQAGDSPQNR